jgi:hypothetical protein
VPKQASTVRGNEMKIDTCPKHKIKLRLELIQTGGCQGHFGEDDRCYCDSPDVHAELYCPGVNVKFCGYRVKTVPGLTDIRAIERWIIATIAKEPPCQSKS